jgi:predicted DCC family thiol-disulfide oxidoreductase YuxK
MPKPRLIYDGDCDFCRRWIERWRVITGDRVEYRSSQDCAAEHPDIGGEEFARAVQWIGGDGRRESGAAAVLCALATAGMCGRILLALYRNAPPLAWAANAVYRLIAKNRMVFSRMERGFFDEALRPRRSFWLILAALILAALSAFLVAKNYPFRQYPRRSRSR